MIRESLLALTLMGGANGADFISTQHAVQAGAMEYNSGIYGPRFERGLPVKVAIVAAETGIFLALRKEHKRAAWVWVASVVAVNLYIAKRNNDVAQRLRGLK